MKNFLKLSVLSILSLSLFILTGCNTADKTLAKNLDNTITNLVYSVTNLDFANSSDLDFFSSNETQTNNFSDDKATDNSCNNQTNDINKNANCCKNCENSSTNQQNLTNYQNYNLNENMSGYPSFNKEFCDRPISKAKYNTYQYARNYTTQSENSVHSEDKNSQEKNETKALVSFSTEQISENNQTLQNLISSLINKRSNLLLYINDLYKGNVSVANTNRNAVNAYMNILKDNTSYFNQHRGLITNQLDQAKELYNSDSSSSLINAYIIRTNEAIATRIAKLESSISAMDSILDIMKGNQNSNSKSYILNNYDNKNNTINNNGKIDFGNKPVVIDTPNESSNNNNGQGLEDTNINTENNNNPTLNNNNIPLPPQAYLEHRPRFDMPYPNPYYNQQGYYPVPYQPYPWQPTTIENCENCNDNKNSVQDKKPINTETKSEEIQKQNKQSTNFQNTTEADCKNGNCQSDDIKPEQEDTNSSEKKTVSKEQLIEDEISKAQDEILSKNEKNNKIISEEKSDKKQTKHDNTLNEKIRENQKEIRENKKSEKSNSAIKNKLSKFFIEDKTNRDRRLKTMTHSSDNVKTISEIKNIEKANNVPFLTR